MAALRAVMGVFGSLLKTALADRIALRTDIDPGRVHHDEHVLQALMLLADKGTETFVMLAIAHHTGRRAVLTKLFFDADDSDIVPFTDIPVLIDPIFRDEEHGDAARPLRRIGQARQHEMADILGQVVIAIGNPDLGALDLVTPVTNRLRLAFDIGKV